MLVILFAAFIGTGFANQRTELADLVRKCATSSHKCYRSGANTGTVLVKSHAGGHALHVTLHNAGIKTGQAGLLAGYTGIYTILEMVGFHGSQKRRKTSR